MNKSSSKLVQYVLKKKNPISDMSLIFELERDENLKVLSSQKVGVDHLVWISGFGEREVFFVHYTEKGKKSYYHLLQSPRKEFETL